MNGTTNHFQCHNVAEIVSFQDREVWSRIPEQVRTRLNPLAERMAVRAAGMEIRFRLISDSVTLRLQLAEDEELGTESALAEVYHGCFQETRPRLLTRPSSEIVITRPDSLPLMKAISSRERHSFRPELVRVVLPMGAIVAGVAIDGDIASPAPGDAPGRRWLAYGSSITYGASASLSDISYVKRAAAILGVDAINLGLPGSALLDEAMAEYIAARQDWEFATLELGINAKWDAEKRQSVPVSVFEKKLERFLPAIALNHPDRWIFCIDMFTMQGDYDGDPLAEPYREAVKAAVKQLNLPRLVHIDGRELLQGGAGLTSDLIHPSNQGMIEIAERLAVKIGAYVVPAP